MESLRTRSFVHFEETGLGREIAAASMKDDGIASKSSIENSFCQVVHIGECIRDSERLYKT